MLVLVSAWDLTFGHFVIDRYLYYLVPVLLLALLCALLDARRPVWSLALPVALVATGFATHLQDEFLWSGRFPLSMDSPIATPYRWFASLGGGRSGASALLAGITVALAALFLVASRAVPHVRLTAVAAAVLLVFFFPLDTGYAFAQLFSRNGSSGRPLTRDKCGEVDWLDRTVGTGALVTEIPYPISSHLWSAIRRGAISSSATSRCGTRSTTPRRHITPTRSGGSRTRRLVRRTDGLASARGRARSSRASTTRVFASRAAGGTRGQTVMLIDAEGPWRTDWLTFGLYDDGWTGPAQDGADQGLRRPRPVARGQRTLSLQLHAPTA